MITPSKKIYIARAIVSLLFAISMFIGAFCLIYFNQPETPTDTSFTFIKYERKSFSKSFQYELYVSEENKPLFISSLANKYINEQLLQEINNGDKIDCMIIDGSDKYSYQIVEISANGKVILSLENAQKAEMNNRIAGAAVTSAIGIIMSVMSGLSFYRVKHEPTQKQQTARTKILKDVLYQNALEQNKSEQEIQKLMDMIDSIDTSDELPCGEEELLGIFKNSFYVKNNRDYTSALEYLQNNACCKVFKKALNEKLNDGELRVFYDAGTIDDSAVFLSCKINGKVLCVYLLNDDTTKKFSFDNVDFSNDLCGEVKLTQKEKSQFIDSLREYNRLRENIFDIDKDLI